MKLALWFVAAVVASVVLSVSTVYVVWRTGAGANCTVTYPGSPGQPDTVESC